MQIQVGYLTNVQIQVGYLTNVQIQVGYLTNVQIQVGYLTNVQIQAFLKKLNIQTLVYEIEIEMMSVLPKRQM